MKFKSLLLGAVLSFFAQDILASVNIFIQPQSQTVAVGSNAVFTATTTTTAGETVTGYTWLTSTNSSGPFSTIPGATGPVLTIANAQFSNSGFYFVRVNYSAGGNPGIAVSTAVTLSVEDKARVTGQPASLTRAVGATASFTVTAAGQTPLNYQWRFKGIPLSNGARISGVNTTNLSVSNVNTNDAGSYDVVVTNSYSSVTSQVAVLTVAVPPAFTLQPSNSLALVGSTVTLSASANGSEPLAYRWRRNGINLSNSGRFSGVTTATLQITGALTNDSGVYSVVVTNGAGTATSTGATLSVLSPPVITSGTNAAGIQGFPFSFALTATGSSPLTFGAQGLPAGLSIVATNGQISGVPSVSGTFEVAVFASNAIATATGNVTLTFTTGAPRITSALGANGRQGQNFSYAILASNGPVSFSVTQLPLGLNFNAASGVISGVPIESGLFSIIIDVSNAYGFDSKALALNIATGAPVITSSLVAFGTENQNFNYQIQAQNSPTSFAASGLPLGLVINTNNGAISGMATVGGTNDVVISARNAWGVDSRILKITVAEAPIADLFITDVTATYSAPYLLDFTFSLRDGLDPATSRAVVRSLDKLKIVCMEGNTNTGTRVPVGNETATIVSRGLTSNAKQLKTVFVMDYTLSMLVAGAIDPMEAAVEQLINQEPGSAQFAVNEFHADFAEPSLVVSNFTSDKAQVIRDIRGIRTNFVQGNYAGSRIYDALAQAITHFGPANKDEQRYLIVMSDGHDDASALSATQTNQTVAQHIVSLATDAGVQLYCVGFGGNPETDVLLTLSTNTGGRYFRAVDASQIASQFTLLLKDLNAQYFLRWATLQRGPAFQPMFEVTVEGKTDSYNTNFPTLIDDPASTNTPPDQKFVKIDNRTTPPTTNELTDLAPDFDPSAWSGDVKVGALNLVPDASTNLSSVTLRAFYVPRAVREIRLHYRANYPCVPQLVSSSDGILNGWSLTQTNDGAGGFWLTALSPDPTNLFSSIPYGIRGDLIRFQFPARAVSESKNAFSLFEIDNSIYTNRPPTGQSFVLNTNGFITVYEAAPPLGTPIPWLVANGFTNDFANAELTDPNGNGLLVWQEYLAGLNPNDPNSTLAITVFAAAQPGLPNQINFNTVLGKTYRVEAAVTLDNWTTLEDGIIGTGGEVSVFDLRNLNSVTTMFYRIAVY